MSVIPAVEHFLQKKNLSYSLRPASDGIASDKLVNAVFISDGGKLILAVYPASHVIDFDMLRQRTRRSFQLVFPESNQLSLRGMQLDSLLPVSEWYGVSAIIEKSLLEQPRLWLPAGDNENLVELDNQAVNHLYKSSIPLYFSSAIVSSTDAASTATAVYDLLVDTCADSGSLNLVSESDIYDTVRDLKRLPPAMQLAGELLQLMADPDLSTRSLGDFVERDPLLTSSVLKHAAAPFYGYRGRLDSVSDAIMHVLGVEKTLNLVMSYVFSAGLEMPLQGVVGRRQMLSNSVQTAHMMEKLADLDCFAGGVEDKSAYLTGLLHNIGYFITSHQFAEVYAAFNRMLTDKSELKPDISFKKIFSVCPARVGGWFLEAWNILPNQASVLVSYDDDQSPGANPMLDMLRLALSEPGEVNSEIIQAIFMRYGLDEDSLARMNEALIKGEQARSQLVDCLVI